MAECRHNDIEECQRKINALSEALRIVDSTDTKFSNISSSLSCLSGTYALAFETANITELQSLTLALDNRMVNMKNNIRSLISSKISQLNSDLSSMHNEDDEHHRQEEENEDDY